MRLGVIAVALTALLMGCAVKGYDLGWRKEGPLTALLGAPLDNLSGCRWRVGEPEPPADCQTLMRRVDQVLAELPRSAQAPETLGATCRDGACTYANTYDRRDVGAALIVPIYKRVSLRETRMGFALIAGTWRVRLLTVRDVAPPGYGPVQLGGRP